MSDVVARCAHFEMCGGCTKQDLNLDTQLMLKEQHMLDVLMHAGNIKPDEIIPPLAGESSWNYRYRARLSVNYVPKKGRVLVGFREARNSRYVADMSECHILHPEVGSHLLELSELIGKMSNPRTFPQIEVLAGDDEVGLVFRHLEPLTETDKAHFTEFSDAYGFRIYLQPKGLDTITLFYPAGDMALSYSLPAQNISYQFLPTDFTQVNLSLNRLMITQASTVLEVNSEDIILDLFCGLGNFSLPLAQNCKSVIGVEYSETMVKRAQSNALLNHISNTQFFTQDLSEPNALSAFEKFGCNKVLLDPPRTGAQEIVKAIDVISPDEILYVSCKPETFAEDASILVHEKGYTLAKVGIMDMFPHTSHVEVMGLFKKG